MRLQILLHTSDKKTLNKGIQILTLSDIDVYGEYKPYDIIESEGDFIKRVLEM